MKTFLIITVLFSTNLLAANGLSFLPSAKKNYVKAVIKQIPSYEVEMKKQANKYVPVAQKIASDLHVSADLVISVLWTESHFKPSATSKVGAKGLMQIMPKTRRALVSEMKNFRQIVTQNLNSGLEYRELEDIILGTYYLNKLKMKFKSTDLAIVAYNMGPTWVSKRLYRKQAVGVKNDYLNKVVGKMVIVALAE